MGKVVCKYDCLIAAFGLCTSRPKPRLLGSLKTTIANYRVEDVSIGFLSGS